MATIGLGRIVLYSSNPGAVSAFYASTTGLIFERVAGTQRYESEETGGVTIVIEAALTPLSKGRREDALAFRVKDLNATAIRLREDGWDVGMILDKPTGKTAALQDPDGRDVELFEPVIEKPAVIDIPAAIVEKPAAVDKPAPVEPALVAPALVEPALVEPALVAPALVKPSPEKTTPEAPEKPAPIAPPALVEKPAELTTKAPVDKPAGIEKASIEKAVEATPPPLVDKPPVRLEMPTQLGLGAEEEPQPKTTAEEAEDKKRGTEPPPPPALLGTPGPLLTAARPAKISCQGGIKISLYGANFADGCRVLVDGDDTTNPRRVDDFTLEIEAPPHAPGPADIIIENADGQRATIRIQYDEGPIIEQFEPLEGSPRGGTEITVEGRNFQEGCLITFFGNRAPAVLYDNPKRIRFITPAQEELFHGEVRITNPDGLGATATALFTYRLATPHISTINPANGLIGGDKRVLVTGVDFHPRCVARLGGQTATINFKNSETLELITPRKPAPGPADLEIENPDGQIAKLNEAFTYEPEPTPPLLVEIRPAKGYCAGGTHIRLIGDNFEADTFVRIGEVRAVSRLISRHEIEVDLPARNTPGLVAVELTDRHGVTVRREDGFTYETRPAPRIDSVTPKNGPMVGGTRLIIEGDLFDENIYVRIGGQTPKKMTVRSASMLEILAPPSKASGFVDIEVGSAAGLAVSKNAFRYDPSPAPSIDSIAPNKGGDAGGTEISIEGKNFNADSIVLIGGKPATRIKFISPQSLEAKSPPGKNGEMVDITVRNPDGKESTSKRAFMYDARYRG